MTARHVRTAALSAVLLVAGLWSTAALAQDTDGDSIPDAIEDQLGLLPQVKQELVLVTTSPDRGDNDEQAKTNAPDILKLEACHVGGERLLFRVTFARKPSFADSTFILYADLDNDPKTGRVDQYHGGVDAMLVAHGDNVGLNTFGPDYTGKTTLTAALEGNVLWIAVEAPVHVVGGSVELGAHLLSQRQGGTGDSTPHVAVKLPFHGDQAVPQVKTTTSVGMRPLSDYRYHDDKVKLEKLEDKGLTYDQVAPKDPLQFGRPRPAVPFADSRKPGVQSSQKRVRVAVQLLEEAGVARTASPIRFGCPFPEGAVFDPANVRLRAPRLRPGAPEPAVAAQFTATAFWPDGSLKWVVVDFTAPLRTNQKTSYAVEFGADVERDAEPSKLKLEETDNLFTVTTGPLRATVHKKQFNLLRDVWFDANADGTFADSERVAGCAPEGVRLVDENGKVFTASARPPRTVAVEESGPRRAVIRVEGDYADPEGATLMSFVARLTFLADSSRVGLTWTHVNTCLRTEFTDLTSLTMPVDLMGGAVAGGLAWLNEKGSREERTWKPASGPLRLFQLDDQRLSLQPPGTIAPGHALGTSRVAGKQGAAIVAVQDFWQRWPKALHATAQGVVVELLPEQPDATFGTGLPHYLLYPFVSGKYRLKWGMSFTDRLNLDFDPRQTAEAVEADTNSPVVAVMPAQWYAFTRALGPLAAPRGKQFAEWDQYLASGCQASMSSKERDREYGFLNYGDWYGERGRNWGNNEYDLAHGFFMQFARTGNRDYFRWALTAARHQADVDCVHAYPDPFYVGANHQHSIGHTGTWSQEPQLATWTHRYDAHTDARNGHTWANGMVEAWYLGGEARVMEAALGLGEHIAWAMSPDFHELGTHERSAGWSLTAIMALYRATYDPVYLEAAKRIVAVALKEQKFDQGGAWPHVLPTDHAGGHPGAVGNNLFLIGVLLGGLKDYHEVTHDPAAEKSLLAGVQWVVKSWDENAEGWPYSATPTGEPLYKPSTSLNTLIMEPVAYAGVLTSDEKLVHLVETALAATVRGGPEAFGKSLAQKMHYTSGTLALLQQWYDRHRPDKGEHVLDGSGSGQEAYLLKTPAAEEFSVRAPDEKVFWVKLTETAGTLVANRSPHGAKNKDWPTGTLEVSEAAGKSVAKDEYSTDGAHEFRTALKAPQAGATYKVVIRDDQRSVWNVSGDNLAVVAQTTEGFSLGGVGRARYCFFVPEGTKGFRVRLIGIHGGAYGGAAISPTGKLVAFHQGANLGQVQLPWTARDGAAPAANAHPERGEVIVEPTPEDTGKIWSLALWAAGDLAVELDGVPRYLAVNAGTWFAPQ